VVSINGTEDSITVSNWFLNESTEWQVEEILFSDGTTWDVDTIKHMVLQGTPADDLLLGYSSGDTISGMEGRDILYGHGGADVLDGGADSDTLDGGAGDDTYTFGRGYGHDTVVDVDSTPGNVDTVLFKEDVAPTDITLRRSGDDLFVSIDGTDDRLQLSGWFLDDAHKIERLQFSDGTVWDHVYMEEIATTPTDSDDYIVGTPADDAIDGGGGSDTIYGRDGDGKVSITYVFRR